jgi:hypothetical protein
MSRGKFVSGKMGKWRGVFELLGEGFCTVDQTALPVCRHSESNKRAGGDVYLNDVEV